jgi:urease accessory protein
VTGAPLVALLHLCDSLFPIGSFAHSEGLETATSRGDVTTAADLQAWMEAVLGEVLRRIEGPAVARAWRAAGAADWRGLAVLDDEVYALRPASSGRESTRAMGSRLLRTWQQLRPTPLVQEVNAVRTRFTLPIAFGVVSAASGIPLSPAVAGFFYTRLAGIVSAAMRLMPLGQREGHGLLTDVLARMPAVADAAIADTSPLSSFTPLMDVMAISHQYVESRLFKS